MCINVACRADVAVPQPLLNLLQAHAIGIEQTGAAMAQIVKADTLHLVCDQKIREMLAQEIGPNPFSHRVYIDIVKIIGAIAFAADLPILLLLLFHFIEHLLTGRVLPKQTLKRCNSASLRLLPHRRSRPLCHTFRAFRHKQDSTLVAEQTTIFSVYIFLRVNI